MRRTRKRRTALVAALLLVAAAVVAGAVTWRHAGTAGSAAALRAVPPASTSEVPSAPTPTPTRPSPTPRSRTAAVAPAPRTTRPHATASPSMVRTPTPAPAPTSRPPVLSAAPPPRGSSLPLRYDGGADQVITVDAPSYGSTTATVEAWNRTAGGWQPAVGPVQGFVGSDGVGQASESTSRTPVGTFGLPMAFGSQGDPGTGLQYLTTGRTDWWDENPNSPTYNEHVVRTSSPGGNSEDLYTATGSSSGPAGYAYRYAIDIGYNTARVPGAGSAIFLHVSDGAPTAGCVSVPEWAMVAILRWVRSGAQIVIGVG